jgi:hypothetical protein
MGTPKIIIDILGDSTKFTKATKDAQTTAQKFSTSIKQGLGIGAGIGAFGLLTNAISGTVDFLGDAVKAGMEEEASIQKLTTSLQANVPAWDGRTDAIERTMKAQLALGFSDDEQRDSLALLVVATHDVSKALDIQRTAMDLARLKGISLADASAALIKIEGGQFRALKALGIVLKEGATQTDALAAVQKAAEGQASKYAETTAGKLLVAQTKFGEKMDELGTAILPVASSAIDVLTGSMDLLGGVVDIVNTSFGNYNDEAGDVPQTIYNITSASDIGAKVWRTYAMDVMAAGGQTTKTADFIKEAQHTVAATTPVVGKLNDELEDTATILRRIAGAADAASDRLRYLKALATQPWLATLQGKLKKASSTAASITVPHGAAPAATGGSRSGLTWVGEQGPELVNLPSGSYVHTAQQSKAMASGGSGISVVVNGSIIGPSGVDELMDMMARRLKLDGVA